VFTVYALAKFSDLSDLIPSYALGAKALGFLAMDHS
jgi:hypothetical protein